MMTCFGYLKNKKQQQKKKKTEEEKEKEKGAEASRRTALTSSAGSVTPCKSTASASPRRGIPDLYQEKAHNLRVFDLDELRNATNEFNRMLRIGQGGFGSVYKGFLQPPDEKGDRVAIAIKKLNQKGLQVISVRMRGLTQGTKPTVCIRVALEHRAEYRPGTGIPEIFSAFMILESELPLLKRMIWIWKRTLFIWTSMLLFIMQLLILLVCCRPVILPRTRLSGGSTRAT